MLRLVILALAVAASPAVGAEDRTAPGFRDAQLRPSSRSTARAAITTRIARGSSRSKATPRCNGGPPTAPRSCPGMPRGAAWFAS